MTTPCSENHEKKYGIPTLQELSHDAASVGEEQFPGGEQEALRRLDEHMKRTVSLFHTQIFFSAWSVRAASKLSMKENLEDQVVMRRVTRLVFSQLFSSFRDGCVALRSPRPPQTL